MLLTDKTDKLYAWNVKGLTKWFDYILTWLLRVGPILSGKTRWINKTLFQDKNTALSNIDLINQARLTNDYNSLIISWDCAFANQYWWFYKIWNKNRNIFRNSNCLVVSGSTGRDLTFKSQFTTRTRKHLSSDKIF